MNTKNKPRGNTVAVKVDMRRSPSEIGCWVNVVVRDADGDLWQFSSSAFNFDMEPYVETKEVG